jgi:hypothetical protein
LYSFSIQDKDVLLKFLNNDGFFNLALSGKPRRSAVGCPNIEALDSM